MDQDGLLAVGKTFFDNIDFLAIDRVGMQDSFPEVIPAVYLELV